MKGHNQRNHKSTTPCHTPKIPTTRLLCECELYMPNYDNDPQMKYVMDNFNKQTQQRFHEYDERMKTTRQKCKEQCNKEIQKIILKDKLEKELMDKFTTLHTDIQSDAIPTCVCEKSIADKVEKVCLRCGGILGAAMPELGSIGATALYTLSQWYTEAIAEATALATESASKAATQAGVQAVKRAIKGLSVYFPDASEGYFDMSSIVTTSTYNNGTLLVDTAKKVFGNACIKPGDTSQYSFCTTALNEGQLYIGNFAKDGIAEYNATLPTKTQIFTTRNINAVNTAYGGYNTSIIAPIIAIVIIVLIMVIIYLILRYRRKKKMKKKLKYIKILEE
ncbi:rifin PIR protein, putative [Plasmodium reichenowi]|uniref:Rifin PIR protein, putative n=1 Tax=Plasmodium reichenowi TaxID=5854 RepID=A0A2P9DTA2_PLARE|nr:rifin PIR protein, putative [Plasmodium reichenowi]